MGSNQRKVYNAAGGANGEPEACPRCGCRHRYTVRAAVTAGRVTVVRVCRNCGAESIAANKFNDFTDNGKRED